MCESCHHQMCEGPYSIYNTQHRRSLECLLWYTELWDIALEMLALISCVPKKGSVDTSIPLYQLGIYPKVSKISYPYDRGVSRLLNEWSV